MASLPFELGSYIAIVYVLIQIGRGSDSCATTDPNVWSGRYIIRVFIGAGKAVVCRQTDGLCLSGAQDRWVIRLAHRVLYPG